MKRSWLSFILALAMVISLVPVSTMAADEPGGEGEIVAAEDSWKLTKNEGEDAEETYTLTLLKDIPGVASGAASKPWKDYLDQITIVEATGVSIGSYVLNDLDKVQNMTLTNCTLASYAVGYTSAFSASTIDRLELIDCRKGEDGKFPIDENAFQNATIRSIVSKNSDLDHTFWKVKYAKTVEVEGGSLGTASMPQGGSSYSPELDSITVKNAAIGVQAIQATSAKTITLENVGDIPGPAIINNNRCETLVINGAGTIAGNAVRFSNGSLNNLKYLTLKNVRVIEEYAFSLYRVETIDLDTIGTIQTCAFWYCGSYNGESNPAKITGLQTVNYIGGRAFHEGNLEWENPENDMPAEDAYIGWNEIFVGTPIEDRMEALLDGQFALDETSAPSELTVPDGWDDSKTGGANSLKSDGTQVTKAAKWTDEDRTKASVEFQFTSAGEPGMDFLFVLDLSNSMAGIGGEGDRDANFYAMQSKALDVTEELLGTPGYDNRVAFVTFGGAFSNSSGTFTQSTFFDNSEAEAAQAYIMELAPYFENTDYVTALEKTRELVGSYTGGKELAVIFISDGMPTRNGGTAVGASNWTEQLGYIQARANEIKGLGVEIFGVLQAVPASEMALATQAMQAVCTNGLFFTAANTAAFSEAVNNAIGAAWGVYTLTDTVDPAFTLVEGSIQVDCGTYEVTQDEAGNTVITWTITGNPFLVYTMSYDLALKAGEDGEYGYGIFDTNEGDARITSGGETVNFVATPRLPRPNTQDTPGDPPGPAPIPNPQPQPPAHP